MSTSFPKFVTFDQAAERLLVPLKTVRYWVSAGKLKAYKPGRHPLIREDDLLAFVENAALDKLRANCARKTRARLAAASTRKAVAP
jgi:excisionase family DNA binding protein